MNGYSLSSAVEQPDRKLFEESQIVQALEGLTDGFMTFDEHWRFTFISPKCVQLFQLPEGLLGKKLWEEFSLLTETSFYTETQRALSEKKTIVFEERCPYTHLWLETRVQPCRNGVTIYYQDLTERLEARAEQSRLVSILEATTDFVSIFDTRGKPPYINRAGRQMLGLGVDEDISRFNLSLHPLWASDLVLHEGIPTARREGTWQGETALLTREGREIPVSEVLIAHKNATGEVEFISTIARDITGNKRAEALLREQAALLDQAPDAIVVCDLNCSIKFWYKGAERMYGWTAEEARGNLLCGLLEAEGRSEALTEIHQHFSREGEWRGELRCRTKAGREIINDCHWTLVSDAAGQEQSILIIHTDVTEKKKLEEQFLRTQRMESIGTLAGGIAHDLNNVLSPILLATRILNLKFTDDDSQKLLGTLRRSAERGADLVRQVLTYARGTDGDRVLMQPKHLINEVVRMLQDTLPKTIAVQRELPKVLWAITGDTTQLYQVVMNLCVNARDAMTEGGTLTICAENVTLAANDVRLSLEARPGDYVVITVADTGMGIPPEIRSKVFEPFFTTKIAGQGSGLGLATVIGIVRSHYGFIDFESEVGRGTSFKVYLPAVKNKVAPNIERESKELPRGQGETILIVDDEIEILRMTSETLAAYGYQTLMANGGDDAVQQCRQSASPIHLALVDMMMPRMDGVATIQALKLLSPALKFITTSGLADSKKLAEANALGASAFLDKPCPPGKMIQTIASVLRSKL